TVSTTSPLPSRAAGSGEIESIVEASGRGSSFVVRVSAPLVTTTETPQNPAGHVPAAAPASGSSTVGAVSLPVATASSTGSAQSGCSNLTTTVAPGRWWPCSVSVSPSRALGCPPGASTASSAGNGGTRSPCADGLRVNTGRGVLAALVLSMSTTETMYAV